MPAIKHADRYREIARILADEGFGSVADQLGLTRLAPVRAAARQLIPGTTLGQSVEVRTRATLERLGPAFVKIGQVLSTRPDLVPDSFIRELSKLQDAVSPMPFSDAEAVVAEEFGMPVDEVFATFDREPLASASIGQVYGATLADGSDVAVKVQRPGIHAKVETDLDIMLTQARFLAEHSEVGTRYNVAAIADEFARAVRDELDYVNEARNTERLGNAFRDDPTVVFPRVHWTHTTPRVLTLERLHGIPMNDPELIDEAGLDRAELARLGITCYLEMIFSYGFYHADPHPGNLFAMPDGRVGFTDFGRVGTLGERSRRQMADLFVAIVDKDDRRAVDVLLEASRSGPDVDPAELQIEISRMIAKYYNQALGDIQMSVLLTEVMDLIRVHGLHLPSEFAVLLSTLAVLEGVGTQLHPEFDFVAVTAPMAREIVAERTEPRNIARTLARSLVTSARVLSDLPDALHRLVTAAGSGDLRMTVRPAGFDPVLARLEALVNRLAFAVVIAAFVLGFAILLQNTEIPGWFVWVARIALLSAAGVGTWFFLAIFIARARRR